jgi:hypothetical protein
LFPAHGENVKFGLPSVITPDAFFVPRRSFFQQEGLTAGMVVMPASLNIKVPAISSAATISSAVAASIRGINVLVMLFVDQPLQDINRRAGDQFDRG